METLMNLFVGNWKWILVAVLVVREIIKLTPSLNPNDIIKTIVNAVLSVYDFFTMPNVKTGGGTHVPNLWAWIIARF
jgi:hypothetical protein